MSDSDRPPASFAFIGAALSGAGRPGVCATGRSVPAARAPSSQRLEPLRRCRCRRLQHRVITKQGPADGPAAILLHGFPYDIHAYDAVAPRLAAAGARVLVPYLRGYRRRRAFASDATPRSGEQAALGADLRALLDALGIPRAVLAGYDWGGRAACVVAALWPERCAGLVTANGYNIQDHRAGHAAPAAPEAEAPLLVSSITCTVERGRAGLARQPARSSRGCCGRSGRRTGRSTTPRSSAARSRFDNPDFVDVVIHSYRHRFGLARGRSRICRAAAATGAACRRSRVPAVTLDGDADGVLPAGDGRASAAKFTGRRVHRVVPGAGHNVPQEAPEAFAAAVMEVVRLDLSSRSRRELIRPSSH